MRKRGGEIEKETDRETEKERVGLTWAFEISIPTHRDIPYRTYLLIVLILLTWFWGPNVQT